MPANAVEKMNYGPPGKAVLCQVLLLFHLGNNVDEKHRIFFDNLCSIYDDSTDNDYEKI